MKKRLKITLTLLFSIILYIAFYYLLTNYSRPETYLDNLYIYIGALIFWILGIPLGIAVGCFLNKKKIEKTKVNIATTVIILIWGFLWGWFSVLGVFLGFLIVEKDKK